MKKKAKSRPLLCLRPWVSSLGITSVVILGLTLLPSASSKPPFLQVRKNITQSTNIIAPTESDPDGFTVLVSQILDSKICNSFSLNVPESSYLIYRKQPIKVKKTEFYYHSIGAIMTPKELDNFLKPGANYIYCDRVVNLTNSQINQMRQYAGLSSGTESQ